MPLFDWHAHSDYVVNFAHRFTEIRQNVIAGPDPGPRTVMESLELQVAGEIRRVEWVGFLEHRELRLLHVPLPEVDVLVLGWSLPDGELASFLTRLERMEAGSELHARMRAADESTRARLREHHDRMHGDGSEA